MKIDTVPERPCPCCSGADEGDWTLLCDDCAEAWLAQNWDHECDRPLSKR